MKRFIPIYIVALFALCFTACEKNNEDNPPEFRGNPITFGAAVARSGLSDLQVDGFGVWAYITNSVQSNFAYMENTKVQQVDGNWVYSPAKYWIDDTNFKFVAAYPYDATGQLFTTNSSQGAVELTVSNTPSDYDYLVAMNTIDTSAANFNPSAAVPLQFKHLLANVNMNVWRDGVKHQNDKMRIIKVTLSNIRKAGKYSSKTDTWTTTNDKLTMIYENNDINDNDNIGAAIKSNDTYTFGGKACTPFSDVMLIPQTIDTSNSISLKIDYELKRQNAANWESAELETILPSNTWSVGQKYTYNVVLSSVTDITVYYIQTKVDPWGTPQVGGTVIIK